MQKKEAILTGVIVTLAIYALAISVLTQLFPALQSTRTLSTTGTIQTIGVGVYSNAAGTNPVTSIPWGSLEPGSNQTFTCYIKSEGTGPSTPSLYTLNWNPEAASTYLDLSWDYGGQILNPGDIVQVTFTLTVSPNIAGVTSFSFDITIVEAANTISKSSMCVRANR